MAFTGTAPNSTNMLFNGVYANAQDPLWAFNAQSSPANLEVSTLTVNAYPSGNILMTTVTSNAVEYNAPILFQRPAADINAPVEYLVMNTSVDVPTKPVDGQYITALKDSGTVYDDIAVAGLQVYGDQTIGSPAVAYITGLPNGDLNIMAKGSVNISSLYVSSFVAENFISTTTDIANSYTASLFMSTPVLFSDDVKADTINVSTLNVSTLNAPTFAISTLDTFAISSIISDVQLSLVSTLSLFGDVDVNLGLGDQIAGLIGGAGGQALGVALGGAGLITGAVALTTGRTSGGVSSNIFQTVNQATQLQFSTIGSAVSSVFLTVNTPNELTTPGLETRIEQGVAAGTYCVRSVGDPLYINNNVSSIQMLGQWVPVIQPTATIPQVAVSSFQVSSINGNAYPPDSFTIPSTIALSTITASGNLTGNRTFNWANNTITATQANFNVPVFAHNTLTTFGAAYINGGAIVNNGFEVASGTTTINSGATINNISSVNISTNNIYVSSVNGAVYPPPVGTPTIPSTLALSTVTVDGNFTQSGAGTVTFTDITANNLQLNNSLTINGQLNTYALSRFRNGVDVVTGNLSVLSGGLSVQNTGTFNNGLTVASGNTSLGNTTVTNLTSGAATFNNGLTVSGGNTSVGSITAGAATFNNGLTVSGGNTSVGNINLTTINNQAYPPASATSVSSITGGNNTIINTQSIFNTPVATNNTLTASGATFLNGGAIVNGGLQVASGTTTINSGATINNGLTVGTGNLTVSNGTTQLNGNVNVQNTIATNRITSVTGSIDGLSTMFISTQNINLATVNGQSYPPASFGIPSTINLSTVNVSGGLNVTAGNTALGTLTAGAVTINNGLTVASGNTSVGNINVNTVNNQPYPPQPGAPSTLSGGNNTISNTQTIFNTTVTMNNSLTVPSATNLSGGATISNGLTVASGNTSVGSISGSSATFNNGLTVSGGNTSLGTLTTGATTINNGLTVASGNTSVGNINVTTINNQAYPPVIGTTVSSLVGGMNTITNIQTNFSTPVFTRNTLTAFGATFLNAGAIVNNGFQVASGTTTINSGATINNGLTIGTGNLAVTNGTTALNGNVTTRGDITFNNPGGPGYLTGTGGIALKPYNVSPVRVYFDVDWDGAGAQYLTLGNGSQFSQDLQSGNIFTGNIGTYYPQEQTAPLGRVFTNLVSTVTLQANNTIAPNLTAGSAIISSINGFQFPQSGLTPTGGIIIWSGGEPINQWAIPAGWLRCDGTEVSKTTYAALFLVIGNNYQYDKVPSTLDMFFLPDLTFAVPMGAPYANTNGTVNGTVNKVPYLKVYFTPWQTDYVNTPIRQCWKIGSVDGQSTAINIGTLFPSDGFGDGASGYPNVYVDTILEFDGYVGYIIVCSHDGTTPLPTTNPSPGLEFTARGAGIRADGTYPFQGFNYEGRAKTTRTQQMDEVAPHNHHYFAAVQNQPPYTALMYNIGQPNPESPNVDYIVRPPTSVDPVYNRTSFNATNILSTISTISLPLKVQNIATTTAPNFVSMSYIIKT